MKADPSVPKVIGEVSQFVILSGEESSVADRSVSIFFFLVVDLL